MVAGQQLAGAHALHALHLLRAGRSTCNITKWIVEMVLDFAKFFLKGKGASAGDSSELPLLSWVRRFLAGFLGLTCRPPALNHVAPRRPGQGRGHHHLRRHW